MAKMAYRLAVVCVLQASLTAQTGSTSPSTSNNQSWTETTQQQGASGNLNPTRTRTSHTESNGRTVESQSLERIGPDGRYVPYLDTEKESVQVDKSTVRSIERSFGRNLDGGKMLVQITEEEQRDLPDGGQKIVRTTSNPDLNGRLQVIHRETQDTRQISPMVRETRTTAFSPDPNGGLSPSIQTEERQTRISDHVIEFRKSTLLPDGNGRWQVQEVREGTIKEDGAQRTRDEQVLRPDADGQHAVTERTVSKDSATAPGEAKQTVETYSTDLPGNAGDGSLHLNQRVTTLHRKGTQGKQITEQNVEERNPGAPGDSPRLTQKTIDIVRPGSGGGTEHQQTILSLDSTGKLGAVWVDTGKSDKTLTINVDQEVAKPAKAPDQAEKTATSKPQ